MSGNGSQVVFLIHPNLNTSTENRKNFQNTVFNSVARILTYFNNNISNNLKWDFGKGELSKSESSLKWGHKFANKNNIRIHSACNFKHLAFRNLQLFKEEMERNYENEENIKWNSHILVQNLMTIMHDFQWEQHEIISPVKQRRKRFLRSETAAIKCRPISTKTSSQQNYNQNYVFVVGPLPRSQEELNGYFEWKVQSTDEVESILMPKHLEQHFKYKHGIKLFWLDTEKVSAERDNDNGLRLMESFMKSHQGCVIPMSLLGIHLNDDKKLNSCIESGKIFVETSNENTCSSDIKDSSQSDPIGILEKFNDTVGSDAVFEDDITELSTTGGNFSCQFPISMVMNYFCNKGSAFESSNVVPGSITFPKTLTAGNNKKVIPVKIEEAGIPDIVHRQLFTIVETLSNTPGLVNSIIQNLTDWLNSHESHIPSANSTKLSETVPLSSCMHTITKATDQQDSSERLQDELIQLKVLGEISQSALSHIHLNGTSLCIAQEDSVGFLDLLSYLHENKSILLVERKCKFCGDASSPFSSCVLFHHYGIFQPLSDKCASLSWQSKKNKQRIIRLLGACHDGKKSENKEIRKFVERITCDYLLEKDKLLEKEKRSSPSTTEFVHDDPRNFQPCMLEPWYNAASPSTEFEKFCDNVNSERNNSTEHEPNEPQFRDSIMSELQRLYKTESLPDEYHKGVPHQPSCQKEKQIAGFTSWEEVDNFVYLERESCLEDFTKDMECMKQTAYNIITATCSHFKEKNSHLDFTKLLKEMEERLNKSVFVSAAHFRTKNTKPERKCSECMLQVFLHLEWYCYKTELCDSALDYTHFEVEDMVQLLRVISLSSSVEKMREFLKGDVTDVYASKCGRLLSEVHNDMMLPLPEVLQEFSDPGADESFFSPQSVQCDQPLSTGPFSVVSSVGSKGSNDSRSNGRQRRLHRAVQIKPTATRQIVVRKSDKESDSNKRKRRHIADPVKQRLFTSVDNGTGSKMLHEPLPASGHDGGKKTHAHVTEDMARVRRDLFATPSKPRRKSSSISSKNSSSEKKQQAFKDDKASKPTSRRSRSVIDTPTAKQRMTALARQRLRQRRSWEASKVGALSATVVEESPLKSTEDSGKDGAHPRMEVVVKRSPRHAIMLTRRHSFYRDGADGKCRTVARAQVVQQHKEAVPPTPRVNQSSSKSENKNKSALFSPKSLLFSNKNSSESLAKPEKQSPDEFPVNIGRTRRRLKLVSEALPSSKSNPVAKTNTQSNNNPFLNDDQAVLANASQKTTAASHGGSGELVQTSYPLNDLSKPDNTDDIPFQSYRDASPHVTSVDTAESFLKKYNRPPPPPKLTKHKKHPPIVSDVDLLSSPPQLTINTPVAVRRSPRIASLVSATTPLKSPPSLKKIGPLDQYVIRTPTSEKQPKSFRTSPIVAVKRKPSPIGDHIQRWPRKKRLSDTTSPSLKSKRRKTVSFDSKSPSVSSELENCDNGAFIVSEKEDKINPLLTEEISPGIEVGQLLKDIKKFQKKRKGKLITPKKPPEELLDEMGVYPLTEKGESSPFRRWTSPRKKPKGKLFHARVGSPSSSRHVPMMMLYKDSD